MAIALFFLAHWHLSVFCQTFFLHRFGAHAQFSLSPRWQRFFHLLTYASQGVGSDLALSAGIAFGVVETLTTLTLGCGSLLYFAGCRTDASRWRTAAVSVCGCLALGAAFGATVLAPLV